MINVKSISKSFGRKQVLNRISFSITKGEIVGLIGPNGSGKSTLLNILVGLLRPDGGALHVTPKENISIMISRLGYFNDMTVENNLKMFAQLSGVPYSLLEKVVAQFQIDFGHKRFRSLSAGMKQRVALAHAFMKPSKLILLDEPSKSSRHRLSYYSQERNS